MTLVEGNVADCTDEAEAGDAGVAGDSGTLEAHEETEGCVDEAKSKLNRFETDSRNSDLGLESVDRDFLATLPLLPLSPPLPPPLWPPLTKTTLFFDKSTKDA